MTYFKQTETKYKSITLGKGTGSIYDFGCYMVSLCNGLQEKGYDYIPEQLNDILKVKDLWIGTTKNLIDVTNIVSKWNDIFLSFKRVDAWGNVPSLTDILKPDMIAIGEVSPVPIGGSAKSQHFVLITGMEGNVAVIYDPFKGVKEKITVRWGSHGNIKGLRLFQVKPHTTIEPTPPAQPVITDQTRIPQIGNMEVQAIRSKLNDQDNTIKNQSVKLQQIHSISG